MLRAELKGLVARKLRLLLTAFAVAIGVTLMAGTYIFTDTINASFDSIFQQSSKGTDVAVTPRYSFGGSDQNDGTAALPTSYLQRVRDVPGVRVAAGSIFGTGAIFDKDGKRIGKGGAPNFIASLQPSPFGGFTVAQGRMPRSADELAMDKSAADRKHFAIGDKVAVQGEAPRKDYRLVGKVRLGGADSFGGAVVVVMQLPEAQRVTGRDGEFDEIDVAGAAGVDRERLKADVRRALPTKTVNVRTGPEQAHQQSDDIRGLLSPLRTALLAFAFIALFVGGFIIFNTFSITVAQRTREFALLRILGANRGQIMRAVVGESVLLGLFGSALGVLGGLGVAPGLRALMKAIGVDLPSNGLVIESRTVIVSLLVGTLVTLVGSLGPALRATRVTPIAALREGVPLPAGRGARLAAPLAVLLAVAGVAGLLAGLFGGLKSGPALTFIGLGAACVFLAVALLSPRLVRPIASLLGRPIEALSGVTGRLARENTVRLPGRTAVTAAALMIGVTLVTFVSVFAAGAKKTFNQAVDLGLRGDLILVGTGGFEPFSDASTAALEKVPGVAAVSPVRSATAKVPGQSGTVSITGIDPATFAQMYRAGWQQGSDRVIFSMRRGDAIVGKKYAEAHDVRVGMRLRLLSATGSATTAVVRGILHDKGGVVGDVALPNSVVDRTFGKRIDDFSILKYKPGVDKRQVRKAVDQTLERQFPSVEANTAKEFEDKQSGQINLLLGLFYALLALAIVVSLFGIVNTLVLSIHERTRELGMMRAIGMSKRQIKRMIRAEAVITSLIGGVLGIVLGITLALLVIQAIDDFLIAIPVFSIIAVFLLSGLAGIGAAVLPARRAAKLDVLRALAYE